MKKIPFSRSVESWHAYTHIVHMSSSQNFLLRYAPDCTFSSRKMKKLPTVGHPPPTARSLRSLAKIVPPKMFWLITPLFLWTYKRILQVLWCLWCSMFEAANFIMGRAEDGFLNLTKYREYFTCFLIKLNYFIPCKKLRRVKTNSTEKYVSKLELKLYFVKVFETIHFCYAKFDTFPITSGTWKWDIMSFKYRSFW